MITGRRFATVGAILAIMLLSACTANPEPFHTNTPAHSQAAPTPVPSATKPTLAQLVVRPDGIGPITIGSPVPAQPSTIAIASYDPRACVRDGGPVVGAPGAGAWLATYPHQDTVVGDRPPFELSTKDGLQSDPITAMWVWSSDLRTSKGIGVGSSVADLSAAYPSARRDHASNSDVYAVAGVSGELLFEVANSDPDAGWEADLVGTVVWMMLAPAGNPLFHIANSDGGGACPV